MSHLAVIALGSNLGERRAHLQQACAQLRAMAIDGTWRQSSIYQTAPVLCPDGSPDFYNAVVSFHFEGSATQLHAHTRGIEQQLGRERSAINAPRTIDIDLLAFGQEIINEPDLQIPHPRLHQRRFVLQPLAEIHPELLLPGLNNSISQQLQELISPEPELMRMDEMW
jgi:2-amino-4-hydroxy-6-hydroxymethyldihydropteridine diphosphokinase